MFENILYTLFLKKRSSHLTFQYLNKINNTTKCLPKNSHTIDKDINTIQTVNLMLNKVNQ